jgi:hypothetical protein
MKITMRIVPVDGGTTWRIDVRNEVTATFADPGDWVRGGYINYPGRMSTVPFHAVVVDNPAISGCFPTLDEAAGWIARQFGHRTAAIKAMEVTV